MLPFIVFWIRRDVYCRGFHAITHFGYPGANVMVKIERNGAIGNRFIPSRSSPSDNARTNDYKLTLGFLDE